MKQLIILALTIISFASCRTVKNSQTETQVEEKSLTEVRDSFNRAIDEINKRHFDEIMEIGSTTIVFDSTECPECPLPGADSATVAKYLNDIASLRSKIRVNADGSIEYEGRIASYREESSRKQTVIEELSHRLEQVTHERDSLSTHAKKEYVTVTKTVKRTFIPWWIFAIMGVLLVVGWRLGKIGKIKI